MHKKTASRSTTEMKTGRIDDACTRYGLGRTSMRSLAAAAGAIVHVGRSYLINFSVLDEWMDHHSDCV